MSEAPHTTHMLASELLSNLFPEEDWNSDHLQKTPSRFVRALRELATPEDFDFTVFASDSDEMVVVKDIPFYTLCAHHLLPFFGTCHIAYIPDGKICGLSKLPRVVKHCSKGLNVQEELTEQIARWIDDELTPQGVAVVMQGEHLCMTMRGVQIPGTTTTTSSLKGAFADHTRLARSEFLALIRSN